MEALNATARVTVKNLLAKFITGLPYQFNSISMVIILRIAVSRAEQINSPARRQARFLIAGVISCYCVDARAGDPLRNIFNAPKEAGLRLSPKRAKGGALPIQ
jgi:hypothetical protein